MRNLFALAVLAIGHTSAFPFVLDDLASRSVDQGVPSTAQAKAISASRTNCGPIACLTFNASDQLVSTEGQYAYASPTPGQVRGPCPGLNAAANHGYLPRSGFVTNVQAVVGLAAAYNMAPDFANTLATYAILIDGDPEILTWSIGGPVGPGKGISYSHNNYEGDSSIARGDAYLNNGDAHSLHVQRFQETFNTRLVKGRGATPGSGTGYTLDSFAQDYLSKAEQSEATNPYYTAPAFAVGIVSPVAYAFVINFMSNHSAANRGGYLDEDIFKTFFAITGSSGSFKWNPGQERIPNNWYRRPTTNQYSGSNALGDLAINYLAYPGSFRIGCNTNGVNSYQGANLTDFTGGVYPNSVGAVIGALSPEDLSPSFQCFVSQFVTQLVPANLASLYPTLVSTIAQGLLTGSSAGACASYTVDQNYLKGCPGASYSPSGPDQTY